MILDDMEERKRKYNALQQAIAISEGKKKAALSRIKEEYGVSSIEEAKKLLATLKKKQEEAAAAEAKAKDEYTALYAKHKDEIEAFIEESKK